MARWIVEAFDLGTECYKGDMGTHVIPENIWLAHLFKCNLKSKGSKQGNTSEDLSTFKRS